MSKHKNKIRAVAVVFILIAALGVAYTQAWFAETIVVTDTNDAMGTVAIGVSEYDNGSVTLANSSDIDIACRIGLIPQWLDDPDKDGVNTIADVSGMTVEAITATSPGWTAKEDTATGKWFLCYTGTPPENSVEKTSYSKIVASTKSVTVEYTATWTKPNTTGTLTIVPVAEAIQATTKAITYAKWEVK